MTPEPLPAAAGAAALLAWVAIAARPARHWDLHPVAEEEPPPGEPPAWPAVRMLVPARNEAAYLPRTLPALLRQDYPGDWAVVLVDDRSDDGTAAAARRPGDGRLTVIAGRPLPTGWAGKVWALARAAEAAGRPPHRLLTDADILHAPGSLRRLVAGSESAGLALNSRMARLRTTSAAERLLVPPFFFDQLYPMPRVNGPAGGIGPAASETAAAGEPRRSARRES